MKEINPGFDKYAFTNGAQHTPLATVSSGETFAVYTHDAFCDALDSTDKFPRDITYPPCPMSGPIAVEGAMPGDVLKVEIISIERVRDWAVSCYRQGLGAVVPTDTTRMLTAPLEEKTYIYRFDESDGKWHGGDGLTFDWEPFIGTIGCAHGLNSFMSIFPFEGGGNMDVPDVKPGNTLYLPVSCPGANLAIGDCHGRQGQGEICGTELEMAAKVTLKVEVVKGASIAWPRIESEDELMCVGAAKPMEDAARIALCELINWLCELGWEKNDAYQAVSQSNKLYVGSMVNPNYVLVAKIAKEIAYRKKNK